jgi:hypothetical protein
MRKRFSPALNMSVVFGANHFYAPRAHPQTSDWISRDASVLDAITCNQLPIAGEMPVICSAGGLRPAGLELLAEAGLQSANSAHAYRDAKQAIEMAISFAKRGSKVIVQHIYPEAVLPDRALWVKPRLLSYLNNKASLPELVPAANVAARSVVAGDAFFGNGVATRIPIVLKVATNLSTGGGASVAICRTINDLAAVRERFADCERLVVETYQYIRRTVCLPYVVLADGSVRYLGSADQDVDSRGRYRGNWIWPGSTLPAEPIDVGLGIVARGASLGYRGFAGIDVVENQEGRWIVLDLNFRVNGSTAAVLLAPAIQQALGQCCLHIRGFVCEAGFKQLVTVARSALRSGTLIPVGVFDATVAGHTGQPSRLSALIVAESQASTQRIGDQLGAMGLV